MIIKMNRENLSEYFKVLPHAIKTRQAQNYVLRIVNSFKTLKNYKHHEESIHKLQSLLASMRGLSLE